MSSVAWKKLHGLRVMNKMLLHDSRYDSNGAVVTYRNKYIDKSRSGENYTLGARYVGRFEEATGKSDYLGLKKRLKQIDIEMPPQRVRKDRVTGVSFCVATPEGLTREQEKQFFEIAYQHITAMCGGNQNCSRGYVHYDERHEYLDAVTGERRMSRAHMHVVGIPFVANKGINGKLFMTKSNMVSLNRAIDKECREKLGVKFMTGAKGLTGRSVEDLQAGSVSMAKKKALEQMREDTDKAKHEAAAAKKELSKAKYELCKTTRELDSSKKQLREATEEIAKVKKDYSSLATRYNRLVKTFNALVAKVKELGIVVDKRLLSHHHDLSR